jgi:hypothetical protein
VPVLNESIFSRLSALCENDNDRISVIRTDLRLLGDKEYIAEGMIAKGRRNDEGVFHVIKRRAAIRQRLISCPLTYMKGHVHFDPFLMERLMLSNRSQRIEPRKYRANEIEDYSKK